MKYVCDNSILQYISNFANLRLGKNRKGGSDSWFNIEQLRFLSQIFMHKHSSTIWLLNPPIIKGEIMTFLFRLLPFPIVGTPSLHSSYFVSFPFWSPSPTKFPATKTHQGSFRYTPKLASTNRKEIWKSIIRPFSASFPFRML